MADNSIASDFSSSDQFGDTGTATSVVSVDPYTGGAPAPAVYDPSVLHTVFRC
jgi:hypothetical protein